MKIAQFVGLGFLVLSVGVAPACSQGEPPAKPASSQSSAAVPAELQPGEAKFTANCSACHGAGGVGTQQGPPLVHKIYEPNHHGDAAFQRAAANGVKAHHWEFGNMPKIEAVTPEDVDQIIKYVRWLQHQAGVF
ncbi:MAG: cytochrome c [Nitrospira sp.]|jgi:mono/diheme cytochrome c family protein|nr:cytochrome c [Nitrospira sp.]